MRASPAESTVVVVVPHRQPEAARRGQSLAAALTAGGHRVAKVEAGSATLRSSTTLRTTHDLTCVISLSANISAIVAAYRLQRRGIPWIADLGRGETSGFDGVPGRRGPGRVLRRLVLGADMLTCPAPEVRRAIFERMHASAALVAEDDLGAINQHVTALVARRGAGSGLRVLMLGPVNSPHLEHLALGMARRGHTVQAGGAVWGGGLPPSALPDAGVPVSVMTWPQLFWARRLIGRFRPDVVHAHWTPFATLAALAGARPLVAMAWGSDVYLADRRQRLGNRLAVRRADLVLADSSALLGELLRLGAQPQRAALFNWGVDLDTFRPVAAPEERTALRKGLGLGRGPVIISPRGLKPLYNPNVVLEAFSQVLTAHPDGHLVLRHQGDEPPDLGPLRGDNRVSVIGRLPYDRVADYFRAADVCVSIPDSDSSPRSVWEAMACGAACVLSDLPWVHELIEDGVHALIAPVDSAAVAGAITRLLEDREFARSITTNALELVRTHSNERNEMDRLEALYHRLASANGLAAASAASSSTSAGRAVKARRE